LQSSLCLEKLINHYFLLSNTLPFLFMNWHWIQGTEFLLSTLFLFIITNGTCHQWFL
jgi:hypothetical protein